LATLAYAWYGIRLIVRAKLPARYLVGWTVSFRSKFAVEIYSLAYFSSNHYAT
jgi:hypothetical protein